jgi:hypothetical protein
VRDVIPEPWEFALLALAAYRLTRLGGWDEFPLAVKVRAWVTGEEWVAGDPETTLPGKTPESALEELRPAYRRQTIAHLIHCPFCLGWWVSLACYVAWLAAGEWALVVLAPFAISGVVGLLAKNLDP